ncbi:MAG: large-conductance mechanosensitive channel protein MscL [Phycisphaerales bacterium]|nr:large-conductance mechanosensitive channel protein MscL [Phycisphaerales bacterium]
MGLMKEFRDFAMRGNVLDLAVGIIIGAAFGKIVNAMVNDVLMPPIGLAMGRVDFRDKKFIIQAADETANKAEVAIKYGSMVNTIIEFAIVAFCVFMIVKVFNEAKRRMEKAKEAAPPPGPSTQEKLLAEIRDLLKTR